MRNKWALVSLVVKILPIKNSLLKIRVNHKLCVRVFFTFLTWISFSGQLVRDNMNKKELQKGHKRARGELSDRTDDNMTIE
jgi:hypothetical protein